MCLKESCFPDCWKVWSVVLVFENVGERSTAKNCCPVSLPSVVRKVFEKLLVNRIADYLEKCGLFLICSTYDSRSSRSTAEIFWQLCLIVFELTTRDSDSLVKFKVLQTNFFQETKKSRTVIISRAENYTKIPQTSVNFTWKK